MRIFVGTLPGGFFREVSGHPDPAEMKEIATTGSNRRCGTLTHELHFELNPNLEAAPFEGESIPDTILENRECGSGSQRRCLECSVAFFCR